MNLEEMKCTKRRIELLNRMGIYSVEELLRTYPTRYETIQSTPFLEWKENDMVCFEGLICKQAYVVRLSKNRSMTKFKVISWDEELEITLFNRPWVQQFKFGQRITLFGQYQGNYKVRANNYNFKPLKEQLGIHPVYSLTEGLKQSEMYSLIQKALSYINTIEDVIPERYRLTYRLLTHEQAYTMIHVPKSQKEIEMALRSLKYEEFLKFQCVMQAVQNTKLQTEFKIPKKFDENKIEQWIQSLPYTLTHDQLSGIHEILKDMKSRKIMFRLVQGDVGCGKTMVAIASLYACALSGYQAVFLAPTEILAKQHYLNLKEQNLPVSYYVSSLNSKTKKEVLDGLKDGSLPLVVGTHALFQENVEFNRLGLVIIDEQQRFGVKQRRSLLEKGQNVDFLMMSATPIPRTYAHFLFGDMDITNIKQMPPGRKPVCTRYIKGKSMAPVLPEILEAIEKGKQCYVVCPSIEENEMAMRDATSIYNGMKKSLKNVRIGLLHGKLKKEEKEEVMNQFVKHEIDILVSTTVIEVGIDVKNATYMVIYDAHRFGLSTLHQLRGRCARSNEQGHCFLLSSSSDEQAIKRLQMLETLTDGFQVTEYDLQIRGPGDILGIRQSGLPNFILGDLNKDRAIMDVCIQDAREILERNEDQNMLSFVHKAVEKAEYFD
ncbi:MAG: ATP-dependent DNA helicase RecG [Floccifex porci]|uniref:Probable DNA 3'-5' helicase RecG n=1 Tax=Floccifex porci TaxID=2606629 RepID=A0A7X2N304_9FIRM|nr:ATP-dependent DNA helicase RecG [Floccifex porci]MCI7802588.1 ATP-dependent DNA helicase RecG [Erysipelotrichaceae bacterium]MDD7466453.1 ATP-dependent DNA helicase RecG [Floccifex porci]MDY4796179.1 ATP-dependent DNA helicase RecG [Floccifex porci]MSS01028.1 ATP-dependent DNA helicase RecG [Floccifex porci]